MMARIKSCPTLGQNCDSPPPQNVLGNQMAKNVINERSSLHWTLEDGSDDRKELMEVEYHDCSENWRRIYFELKK